MSNIEIELRDLTSGGGVKGSLDIKDSDDFPLSLTYLIADIKNLAIRSGAYSKTFNVPATKNNNDLLKHIWNPNTYVDGVSTYAGLSHKMLQRKPCIVKVDGVPILRGEIKIKNIITKSSGKEYVLQMIGNNSDWVKTFETLYLNELTSFDTVSSNTDHTYNKTTIENSWSGGYSDLDTVSSYAFFYPLINYGTWKNVSGAVVEDLKPAVYVRALLDAAFRETDYRISSTFLDTADFKKLIMPFTGSGFNFTDAFINNRKFRASVTSTASVDHTITTTTTNNKYDYTIPFNNDSTNLNSDAGNLYNTTTYKYIANSNYLSTFKGELQIQSFTQGGNFEIYLKRIRGASTATVLVKQFSTVPNTVKKVGFNSGYINLQTNDEVQIYIKTFFPSSGGSAATGYNFRHRYDILGFSSVDRSFVYNEINKEIKEGQSVVLKDILPDTVTVLDIIKGIAHAFNLYFRTDTANKIVYIEPRDTFYDDITTANDWTDKLNKNDYQLAFIDDYKKKLTFEYKNDSNDGHLKARNEEYEYKVGEYRYNLNDRFMIGKQKFTNPTFAPTYHIMDRNLIYSTTPLQETKDKAPLIARLWRNWNGDDAGQPKHFEFEPRLLYKSYGTQTDDNGNNRAWDWEGTSTTNIPTALMRGYGDVTQTNLSYNGSDGLFQTHYGKYINVIEKGVILTATFNLDTQDIAEINLKKPVFISSPSDLHGYYVINKIIDYAPSKSKLTKVELVKIENQGTATFDSNQEGSTLPNRDYGEVGGMVGYDNRNNPWNIGNGGKFDDDDPVTGIDTTGGVAAVLDNGTNYAKSGSNNTVFGEGNVARGKNQTVVGSYAAVDNTSFFQVGTGTNADDRQTALKIDSDGEMVQFGGQIQAIIDGVVQDVLVEDADNERYIKLFKS